MSNKSNEKPDGVIEVGERVVVKNVSGAFKRIQCVLRSADPYVVVEDSVADVGEVPVQAE